VNYYKLDRRKDILQMEKDKKEESRFSVVHAEAMVDGGSVPDMYDKTIGGVKKLAKKMIEKHEQVNGETIVAHKPEGDE
jgi:RNase P/RNase MRP subunit POP5